jgi:hypothetical protein
MSVLAIIGPMRPRNVAMNPRAVIRTPGSTPYTWVLAMSEEERLGEGMPQKDHRSVELF